MSDSLNSRFSLADVGSTYVSTRHSLKAIRYLRANRLRRPDLVLTHGLPLVEAKGSGLSEVENYSVHEEVYIASLDLGEAALSARCLGVLRQRFTDSKRVKILEAMGLEAQGKLDEALAVYTAMLEEEPSNTHVCKRFVAVLEQMGKAAEAAKALVDYLETYSADGDAWFELARLYLAEGQHRKAAFCYEELLLLAPTNHAFHLKYAEILYTLGTAADLKTARGYFAHALNLCPQNNARALYGLLMCCQAMGASRAKADAKTVELLAFASQQLKAAYQSNPAQAQLVERMLATMAA